MIGSLRVAIRTLAKTPVVSLVVLLSLALGIGANTAIFSLLYQVLLRSLPVERPQELVVLTSPGDFKSGRTSTNNAGGMGSVFSYKMFRELEKNPRGLTALAGFRSFAANFSFEGKTLDGRLELVSGRYFPVLGVRPLLGRMLTPADDQNAGQPVVVLSYGYWSDKLAGRTDVLNRPLRVNGHVFTIVGVVPKAFQGTTLGAMPDVYAPMVFKPKMTPGWDGTDRWDDYWVYVFGRLQPGVALQQAQSGLNGTYAGLVEEQSRTVKGRDADYLRRFRASRLTLKAGSIGQSELRSMMKTPLTILMWCTGLVLLIAAANAANLLLARAAQRTKELAIRAALGARQSQVMGQLMLEAMLLAVGGGLVGLLVSVWSLDLLISSMSDGDSSGSFITASLDPQVLLFGLGVALLTGLVFGLYPSWSAARASVSGVLKEESNQSSATRGGVRARQALVCAQVAISLVLLIPMGLFLKSLVNLSNVDLGIKTENLLTFGTSPELNGYPPERCLALFQRAEEELSAIPGVSGVTTAMVPLIGGSRWGNNVAVEGYSTDINADTNSMFNAVGPGFFSRTGIPLIVGREFTANDTPASPKVAVVNEAWAKHFFGSQNPIGRQFGLGAGKNIKMDYEIVGVVKDSNYSGVREKSPRLYYVPYRQSKDVGSLSFYVRSTLPVEQVTAQIRRVMSSIDPDLPLEGLRTMEDQVRRNIRSDRLVLQLAASFAILATFLAMLGLYGVLAFAVTRRTREIGIRIALGAGLGRIRGMVMREVLLIVGAGSLVGVPGALAMAKLAKSQLFGVESTDISVFVGALAALAAAAVLAGYLPARRASRVNPLEALRYE